MAEFLFGSVPFDADLVVFDKDGTLIDFAMWGTLTRAWVKHLAVGEKVEELSRDLFAAVGYDPVQGLVDGQGPLAIATTGQLQTIAAAVLYRHGASWPEAEDRAREAFRDQGPLPLDGLVRPAGDVLGLFSALSSAGVQVAVATTDDRLETEETLRLLSCSHLVDALVCGDDGFLPKPSPDMLAAVCRQLGALPSRTAVVGDTLGDMLMAQRGGAGLKVGVLSGAGSEESLARLADTVLRSIDNIRVAGEE
jgi:phosphoglycolate phosphatase